MRYILAFLALFSAPLQAQDMLPEYQVLGHIDLVMDGAEQRFRVVAMPKQGRSFGEVLTLHREAGIFRIKLTGITPREDGHWMFPTISVHATTNEDPMLRSIYISYSTESFRDDYAFTASTADQTAEYEAYSEDENGLIEFDFRGQLMHQDRDPVTGLTTPQAGVAPVEITGHVSVTIPAQYREE